jgi:hypothetical protein
MFAKRLAVWLALPVAVLAALALGHLVFRPDFEVEVNQFEELLGLTPILRPDEVLIELIRADGSPAEGAVVVLLEPEMAIDYADAEGQVRLQRTLGGPLRLQAYAPGHELITLGPIDAADVDTLQFETRIQPQIPELAPERLVQHDVQLLNSSGQGISGVQVIARRPVEVRRDVRPFIEPGVEPSRYEVPWVAFSDEDGWIELEGLPELPIMMRAYPLGLPRKEAWELDSMRLAPIPDGESEWRLSVARLILWNLPAHFAMQAERLDVAGALPMRRVPADGELSWLILPPGKYRFTVEGETREFELFAGENRHGW